MIDEEERLVRELGDRIGYGRAMQLCEKLWGDKLVAMHGDERYRGGAHSRYCCITFLVPCPGCEPARIKDETCDWCCGAGRVTERVARAIRALDA